MSGDTGDSGVVLVEMLLVYPPVLLYHVSDMRYKTSCTSLVELKLK